MALTTCLLTYSCERTKIPGLKFREKGRRNLLAKDPSSRNCMKRRETFHVFQRAHLSRISSARDFSTRGFQSARFCRLLPLRGKSCKGNLVPFRQDTARNSRTRPLLIAPSFLLHRSSELLLRLDRYWIMIFHQN